MHPGDDKVARIANMSHTMDKTQMTNKVVQHQISTENETKEQYSEVRNTLKLD